jgi:hypothetical protein
MFLGLHNTTNARPRRNAAWNRARTVCPCCRTEKTRFYCGWCWLQHEDFTICGMCIPIYCIYIYIHIRTHAWHVLSIYYICMTCIIYLHIYSQEVLPGYAYMYILCNRKNNKGYDWCKCTYRSITWIRIEKEWGCNGYNKPQKDAKDCFQDVNKDETLTSHFQDSHCVLH